jgi:antirestriction protein ArdC
MNQQEIAEQALANARNNESMANYAAIFEGFAAKGISQADIEPRINVFTFHAWKAIGRQVRKGEHGVKVCSYVPMTRTEHTADGEQEVAFRAPRMTTVFHVSQTDPVGVERSPYAVGAIKPITQPAPKADYYSTEFTPSGLWLPL